MAKGARNIHALAGTLRRLEREAATGPCALCREPSIGFISRWDGIPAGVCEKHAEGARLRDYVVHREESDD